MKVKLFWLEQRKTIHKPCDITSEITDARSGPGTEEAQYFGLCYPWGNGEDRYIRWVILKNILEKKEK